MSTIDAQHEAIRKAARAEYETDDIEIDDDARVSASTDGGSWVQAWVWVSNEVLDEYDIPEVDCDNAA